MDSPVGVWRLTEGQTPRISALRPNLRYYTYSMCTVPILRLLPQYKEVKEDVDVRGFSPQNLMVSSSYLLLFILFICLCLSKVCQGSISCRHIEQQPQLTPTKQVFNKCLVRTWSLCKHNTSRLIYGLAK